MKQKDPNELIAPTDAETRNRVVAQLMYWLEKLCQRKVTAQLRLDGDDIYCKRDYTLALKKRLGDLVETNTWANLIREYVNHQPDDGEEHDEDEETVQFIEREISYQEKRIWFCRIHAWWEQVKLEALHVQLEKELIAERSKVKKEDVVAKLSEQELAALGLDRKGNLLKGKR